MKKIGIKQFCEGYKMAVTSAQKDKYVKDNLEVILYIPFLNKNVLIDRLLDISMYEYENYTDEEGQTQKRKTNRIKINSTVQYLLFCRLVIENYTNLKIETEGFYEEYDDMKSCGLFDKLFGNDGVLPMEDITELRNLIDMKQKDILTNYASPQNYISNQIERITTIGSIILKPILEKISDTIATLDDEKISKLEKLVNKGLKRVK